MLNLPELKSKLPLVVGVSGGADSLALLALLHTSGIKLIVAHFNHQLRPEAEQDSAFVQSIANQMNLPFVTDSANVADYALKNGLSTEEAARKLRYQFLFREARLHNAQAVAVAHTADDQAETVLMHFIRGAGLSGLKGMLPLTILTEFDKQIPLIRPILHLTRAETEAICKNNQLNFRLDASNQDTTYFRNRLRHELIPILERYNPQVRAALAKTAQALQGDLDLINHLINQAWQVCVKEASSDFISFNVQVFKQQPDALKRHLFRRAAFMLRPSLRDVDFDVLTRAATLQNGDFCGGLYILSEGAVLYLAANEADLPFEEYPFIKQEIFIKEGILKFENNWQLSCERLSGNAWVVADEWSACLDADLTAGKLRVSQPKAGDWLEPLGMAGKSLKLSDLFINLKIPKRMRKTWPVLYVGNEVVWVTGLRMSHKFAVRPETKTMLRLDLKKTGGD